VSVSGPSSTFVAHRLVYRATTTITPSSGGPSTKQAELVLVLGPDWQSSREGSREQVVDTASKRLHVIDHEAGTIFSQSLYAKVAFRAAEASNRVAIMEIVKAGGGEPPCTRADIEAWLGVELDAPSPPRFRRPLLQRNQWMHGQTKVASVVPSDHALPAALIRRWLAHDVMVHPKVADAIAAGGRAPQQLDYCLHQIGKHYERSMSLVAADEVEVERDTALRGLEPWVPKDEVHAHVRALLERPLGERLDRRAKGFAALEAGEHFEAFLWFMAHNWVDPSNDPSGMVALGEVLREDEFANIFRLAVLRTGEGKHLDAALQVYDLADPRAGELSHIIGVVRANLLTQLAAREKDSSLRDQMLERARAELLHAIQVDPGLAGVYKDLGDLYLDSYDMPLVWELWDFGRALSPRHWLFESVAAYERHLATRYVAFF
jgi:hypothetical protein